MPKKLNKKIIDEIDRLSEIGNQLARRGEFEDAMKRFWEAFDLVPDPKERHCETTWLISSIGDMLFKNKEYDKAKDAFSDAVRLPGGLGNVFIHLRLGEILYELGDKERAADELARAYMGGGRDAFKHEDPKYFGLVEKVLKPPHGMDRLP